MEHISPRNPGIQRPCRRGQFGGLLPHGKSILTGSGDNTAKLWDLSGREIQTFQGRVFSVKSAAFSPDGKYVLAEIGDKTAKLWDLSGREIQTFKGHNNWINAVVFSPDGKYVLTGSGDKTAKIWETLSGKERAKPGYDPLGRRGRDNPGRSV